ncbi:MAG: hypothetical protein NTX15_09250 [Candidatus Kapabacteria bacterium]|nr:hypothetical protein [Candidatus Kapabacteria bacterium]
MKRIGMAFATATFISFVGCTPKEEPKPVPVEMPAPAPVAPPMDTMPKVDTVKAMESTKTMKKKTSAAVQKNDDGNATAVQVRPSRTEKKEDDASTTQIRKSR